MTSASSAPGTLLDVQAAIWRTVQGRERIALNMRAPQVRLRPAFEVTGFVLNVRETMWETMWDSM